MKAKNIEQALIINRPDDKIVKILNNKYAIVNAAFDNGTFDKDVICFLSNGTVYFYPALVSEFNQWFKYVLNIRSRTDKRYFRNITKAYILINNL